MRRARRTASALSTSSEDFEHQPRNEAASLIGRDQAVVDQLHDGLRQRSCNNLARLHAFLQWLLDDSGPAIDPLIQESTRTSSSKTRNSRTA
jgi:hypothetical protein